MTNTPHQLKVFLCHSSHDKAVVRELYQRLNAEGWIDPWLDEENLYPGQDWDLEIEKAVETADAVIICLSNNSVSKEGYLQRELRFVLRIADYKPEGTVFVIPVRLDDCHIPRRLEMWQYVEYFPESRKDWAYQRLLGSLKVRAQKLGIPTVDPLAEEKARKEKQEREAREKAAREKSEREAAQKAAREQAEREAAQKAAREKAEREAADRAAREKAEQAAAMQVAPLDDAAGKPFQPFPVGPNPSETKPRKLKPEYIVAIIGAAATLLAALIGILPQIFKPDDAAPTATSSTLPLTPLPTEITDSKGVTMRLVPAGEFTMGSDNHWDNEKPAHKVSLDDFYMDVYEVTNALYKDCVEIGPCTAPSKTNSYTRGNYYGNPEFDNYPVIHVDWNQANTYCEWRGARLPTEAEWEKAARGGLEGKLYPWGDDAPVCSAGATNGANFRECSPRDTSPVGSYAANRYGLYDMAGNVWEWVDDWYAAYPGNTVSDSSYGTTYRVLRGGSWIYNPNLLRVSYRVRFIPSFRNDFIGFRCSR